MSSAVMPRRGWVGVLGTLFLMALSWVCGMTIFGATIPESVADPGAPMTREDGWISLDILLGQVACLALLPALRARSIRWAGPAAVLALSFGSWSAWSAPVALYAVYRSGRWRDWRWTAALVVALLVGDVLAALTTGEEALGWGDWLILLPFLAALHLWGVYRGYRQALREAEAERVAGLIRERDAAVARTRAEERLVIAREMHDTLSHRLSVVSLYSGALASRDDLQAGEVREAARLVQSTAQAASEELHDLLTTLRSDGEERDMPLSLADIDGIVADARSVGTEVEMDLPAAVRARFGSLGAQRSTALAVAVREGLANALKHARGAPVHVELSEEDGGLRVLVSNPASHAAPLGPGGHGLVGVEERLRLADGHLTRRVVDGEHRLEAWAPWS